MEFHSSSDVQSRGYAALAQSAFLAGQALINTHHINYINGRIKLLTVYLFTRHKSWISSEAKSKFGHNIFCPGWPVTTIPRGYQKDCEGQVNARGWAIPAMHFVQELTLYKILESLISAVQTKLGIPLPAGEENGI